MGRHYRKTTLLGTTEPFEIPTHRGNDVLEQAARMLSDKLFHSGMVLNITDLDKVILLHLGLLNL